MKWLVKNWANCSQICLGNTAYYSPLLEFTMHMGILKAPEKSYNLILSNLVYSN